MTDAGSLNKSDAGASTFQNTRMLLGQVPRIVWDGCCSSDRIPALSTGIFDWRMTASSFLK